MNRAVSSQLHAPADFTLGKDPREKNWTGDLVGPIASLNAVKKKKDNSTTTQAGIRMDGT
jgi:hypothetical protein